MILLCDFKLCYATGVMTSRAADVMPKMSSEYYYSVKVCHILSLYLLIDGTCNGKNIVSCTLLLHMRAVM